MKDRVLGVLAGDRVNLSWLNSWLGQSTCILAADGGADLVLKCGFQPDFLIGDLDSASSEAIESAKEIVKVMDQDYSDCQKLMKFAFEAGHSHMVLCGVEGTRVDHCLHAIHTVARWPGICMIAYETMLARVLTGPDSLRIVSSGTLSALPLDQCAGVSIDGVQWPVDSENMSPSGFSSISNANNGNATVSIHSGNLLVAWSYDGTPQWDV